MVNLNVKEGIDASSSLNNKIPTGALMMKASAATLLTSYSTDVQCIAAGYIPCDGRALNASTYPAYQNLFNIIGNIYTYNEKKSLGLFNIYFLIGFIIVMIIISLVMYFISKIKK